MGYPLLVKSQLLFENPNEYEFVNTGISGNRIVDLYAAIKARFINHKPDYASILIGVNDVWHEIGDKNGVDTDKFEKIYSMLIEEIKEALPDIKLIILEPELLRTEMHTYFMDWNPDYIDFGVDNQVYFRAGITDKDKEMFANPVDMDVFRLPVYFILSEYLYTPGRKLGWGLKGDEEPFKYVMKVDHVALYQKEGEEIYFK